jgi:hypothetical protein
MRVIVQDLLVAKCGWSEQDARRLAANVSHYYDNHIRAMKAAKDLEGIAVYDENDVAGLMEAAHNIRNKDTSDSPYNKPTKYTGSTDEEMGF